MMIIYLASSFKYVEQVKQLASWLSIQGNHVNCKWWEKDYKDSVIDYVHWWNQPEIKAIYKRSYQAIQECDILILVTPKATSFNGANVEVGIALSLGKAVIAFGELERSGMYEPLIRIQTYDQLKVILKEFER